MTSVKKRYRKRYTCKICGKRHEIGHDCPTAVLADAFITLAIIGHLLLNPETPALIKAVSEETNAKLQQAMGESSSSPTREE